jgi:hypothetical protein
LTSAKRAGMLLPPMKQINVQLTSGVVSAEVIAENPKTLWVRLPDGNVIKRHKVRHLPKEAARLPVIDDFPAIFERNLAEVLRGVTTVEV